MKLEPTPHTDSNDRETLSVVNKKPSSAPVRAEKFEFLDGVAAFHATAVKKARERQTLVANIGPHRRALCARRDLAVRRALCKVDKVCLSVLWYCAAHLNNCTVLLQLYVSKSVPICILFHLVNYASVTVFTGLSVCEWVGESVCPKGEFWSKMHLGS